MTDTYEQWLRDRIADLQIDRDAENFQRDRTLYNGQIIALKDALAKYLELRPEYHTVEAPEPFHDDVYWAPDTRAHDMNTRVACLLQADALISCLSISPAERARIIVDNPEAAVFVGTWDRGADLQILAEDYKPSSFHISDDRQARNGGGKKDRRRW